MQALSISHSEESVSGDIRDKIISEFSGYFTGLCVRLNIIIKQEKDGGIPMDIHDRDTEIYRDLGMLIKFDARFKKLIKDLNALDRGGHREIQDKMKEVVGRYPTLKIAMEEATGIHTVSTTSTRYPQLVSGAMNASPDSVLGSSSSARLESLESLVREAKDLLLEEFIESIQKALKKLGNHNS